MNRYADAAADIRAEQWSASAGMLGYSDRLPEPPPVSDHDREWRKAYNAAMASGAGWADAGRAADEYMALPAEHR